MYWNNGGSDLILNDNPGPPKNTGGSVPYACLWLGPPWPNEGPSFLKLKLSLEGSFIYFSHDVTQMHDVFPIAWISDSNNFLNYLKPSFYT